MFYLRIYEDSVITKIFMNFYDSHGFSCLHDFLMNFQKNMVFLYIPFFLMCSIFVRLFLNFLNEIHRVHTFFRPLNKNIYFFRIMKIRFFYYFEYLIMKNHGYSWKIMKIMKNHENPWKSWKSWNIMKIHENHENHNAATRQDKCIRPLLVEIWMNYHYKVQYTVSMNSHRQLKSIYFNGLGAGWPAYNNICC